MSAGWKGALDKLDATLDRYMGEQVSIVPMIASDFGTRADSDREVLDVTALVVEVEPSQEAPAKMQTRFAHEEMSVSVLRSELAGARIAKGDEIILLDRPAAPRLIITRVDRLDPARVMLICGPVKD